MDKDHSIVSPNLTSIISYNCFLAEISVVPREKIFRHERNTY